MTPSPVRPPLPVLGFDTETTGIRVASDRIVTAALVHRAADGSVSERTWLLSPDVDIPARATAIHGITTEHARAAGQDRRQGLEQIASAIVDDGAPPLVAFNAPYDLAILEAELRRVGLATLAERLGRPVGPVLDPLVIDRGLWPRRPGKRTLDALLDVHDVDRGGASHDALADVRATITLLDALLATREAERAGLASMAPADVHAWQVTAHRAWAQEFNAWLTKRGRVADVEETWV
jgi:DNA polymerase-3 subunit epsilon